METNKNVQDKIDTTFEVINIIKKVNISSFFKDRTMHVLFTEEKKTEIPWNWFTPRIQLATLVCLVILNAIALAKLDIKSPYDEGISEFAQAYGLSINSDYTSILN